MPLTPGQILNNRYRIVKLLGQGGFGAVYRAWDMNMTAACAVKENFDTSPAAQSQFEREAKLLFGLRHSNLPLVYDHFLVPGQGQYLVMDFIEGQDLQEKLDQGAVLTEAQVLTWIGQVADALGYMHRQSPPVIHRDVKPANIVINPQGEAVLVDFGIAKAYDPRLKTTQGARAVTPGYSPHEQYGQGTTDARSDVYALGATLYTMLTGSVPVESIQRLVRDPLLPARQVNLAISEQISATIQKAMSNDPDQRYQTVTEFKAALQQASRPRSVVMRPQTVASSYQQTTAPSSPPLAPPVLTKRMPFAWIGLGMLVVALISFLLWRVFISGEGITPPDVTRSSISTTLASREPGKTQPPPTPTLIATWTNVTNQTPTITLSPTQLPTRIVDLFGIEMAMVPAGEFQMGSDNGDSDERPVHTVYLDNFYIDIKEVTNGQYAACVSANACQPPHENSTHTHSHYYDRSYYADFPVVWVDWFQARDYCAWRGARLPTEAEWEKSARGGIQGAKYPWGDYAPTCKAKTTNGANFCPSIDDITRGGSYAPNGYGVLDMAGNAWEWVSSLYMPYPYDAGDGRENMDISGNRSLRGGGWAHDASGIRVANRDFNIPSTNDWGIGFRCARSP